MLGLSLSLTSLAMRQGGGGTPGPANDNILTLDNGDFLADDNGNLLENA